MNNANAMKYGFIKVAAATPVINVADCYENAENIISDIHEAEKNKVKLVVFPELCITGYTIGDLVYSPHLLDNALIALNKIADATKGLDILVFVGLPYVCNSLIYNVAAAVYNGKVLGFVPKTFLPNYNEFYEKRHFAQAADENIYVKFNGYEVPFGKKIIFNSGVYKNFAVCAEICEDLWVATPPSVSHSLNGAIITANLSCSNETIGKADYRKTVVSAQSGANISAYIYACSGYGESTTDLVFSGHNLIAENGKILEESELFENKMIIADVDVDFLSSERAKYYNYDYKKESGYLHVVFDNIDDKSYLDRNFSKTPFVPDDKNELVSRASLIIRMQAEGLRKRMEASKSKTAVIGLSGGLDSTLALIVSVKAFEIAGIDRKNIIAVTMPCFGTTDRTLNNALKLAQAYGVTIKTVNIAAAVTQHFKDIAHSQKVHDVTYENAQARERTQVLMDIANSNEGIVVGTGDLSETALGWSTYNGDHMSMYGVNCSVPKTLVRHLVNYVAEHSKSDLKNILKDILDTPVSPELLPPNKNEITQKTEDIVGPYELHDFFLYYFVRMNYSPEKIFFIAEKTFKDVYDGNIILKWLKKFFVRFFTQQFKRSCIPDGVKVGSVALSPRGDWRMPSDASVNIWLKSIDDLVDTQKD